MIRMEVIERTVKVQMLVWHFFVMNQICRLTLTLKQKLSFFVFGFL